MSTLFATSPDGTRLAYECSGTGPALVLLHGGGHSRQMWREVDYVSRLLAHFTVIALDLRGHGESSLPSEPADYAVNKMVQDVLAVVDACGVERFALWGFSFGGKVGRYVAAQSERVISLSLMGTPLGVGVSDGFRQDFAEFCAHWTPIVRAQRDGVLDLNSLSTDDREFLGSNHVAAMIAWGQAMIDWPLIEPADFRCPVLWLVGSEDQVAMVSVKQFTSALPNSTVQLHIVEDLNHGQVFEEIDQVFGTLLAFTQAKQ